MSDGIFLNQVLSYMLEFNMLGLFVVFVRWKV